MILTDKADRELIGVKSNFQKIKNDITGGNHQ